MFRDTIEIPRTSSCGIFAKRVTKYPTCTIVYSDGNRIIFLRDYTINEKSEAFRSPPDLLGSHEGCERKQSDGCTFFLWYYVVHISSGHHRLGYSSSVLQFTMLFLPAHMCHSCYYICGTRCTQRSLYLEVSRWRTLHDWWTAHKRKKRGRIAKSLLNQSCTRVDEHVAVLRRSTGSTLSFDTELARTCFRVST